MEDPLLVEPAGTDSFISDLKDLVDKFGKLLKVIKNSL